MGKILSKNTKIFKRCSVLNAPKAEVYINSFLPHRKQCHYYKDHIINAVERNNFCLLWESFEKQIYCVDRVQLLILNCMVHIVTTFMVILLLFLLPSSFYGDTPALPSPFFLLWWYSCSSFSLLPFINHFSLAFFISSIANLHSSSYHLFLNVSFSISCCSVSLIIVLILSHFLLILLSILNCVGLGM